MPIVKAHFLIPTRREHMVTLGNSVIRTFMLMRVDASLMQVPTPNALKETYGDANLLSSVRLVTLAPELQGSKDTISTLVQSGIRVSLGHSASDYDTGLKALDAGAGALTHVFNTMSSLNHRQPSLPGLITSSKSPFYSIIPDGIHLHPATVAMAFRANPRGCMLITDSIELSGLPDGTYPGHAQIQHYQQKVGNKVTIEGTDVLIGSCISMDECVRNLVTFSKCSLAESVRCATENIANFMGLKDRGILETGRRADFVVLDHTGHVLQTWIGGKRVHSISSTSQTC